MFKFIFIFAFSVFVILFFLFTRSGFFPLYILCSLSLFYCFFIPNLPFWLYLVFGILIFFPWFFYPFRISDTGAYIFYGIPGSGKTTMAAYLTKHSSVPVYSNVPIVGAFKIDRSDIGNFDISSGILVIDEAGSEFNARFGTKKSSSMYLDERQAKWIREFRHYHIQHFILFSQRVDIDPIVRDMAVKVYILKKTRLKYITIFRGCSQRIAPNPPEGKRFGPIEEGFALNPFDFHLVFNPPLWSMFDSYDSQPLPHKDFPVWGNESKYSNDSSQ